MKTKNNREGKSWKNSSQYHITSHFSTAYGKSAIIVNDQNGFRKTGIWQVNTDRGYLKTSYSLPKRQPIGPFQNQINTSTAIQDKV
jgi:hypothetical protein